MNSWEHSLFFFFFFSCPAALTTNDALYPSASTIFVYIIWIHMKLNFTLACSSAATTMACAVRGINLFTLQFCCCFVCVELICSTLFFNCTESFNGYLCLSASSVSFHSVDNEIQFIYCEQENWWKNDARKEKSFKMKHLLNQRTLPYDEQNEPVDGKVFVT